MPGWRQAGVCWLLPRSRLAATHSSRRASRQRPSCTYLQPRVCSQSHCASHAPYTAPRLRSCWTEGADASAADEYVFSKLVALFEGRPGALGWDQLVELAQHAQLGDAFVLR